MLILPENHFILTPSHLPWELAGEQPFRHIRLAMWTALQAHHSSSLTRYGEISREIQVHTHLLGTSSV